MNSWEPTSFTAVEISKNLNDHIFEVPRYQRAFVWSAKQKDEFIDTLKRGLPFGTILLYRDDTKNQYQIIDGYQRCTTIREFINHPAPFFSEDDIEETVPHQLAKLTDVVNSAVITINVTNHLVDWVHSAYQSMDDVRDMQYIDYAYAFTAFYPSAQGREQEIAKVVKPTLQQFKKLCESLCTAGIPAIVIKGDVDALPIIFERINSKGTQLSKYQIYAATWRKQYKISSAKMQDLVKYNKEYYEDRASDGTDIAEFTPVDFMMAKKLNLFEVAYGLGKMLGNMYPNIFSTKEKTKDVDSLGFSLITACVGIKNSQSKNLHTEFDNVVGDGQINLFLERLIQCVETTNKLIGKFNEFKVNSKDKVGPLHTEFQIVSLIANIFVARYAKYEKDDNDRIINFTLALQGSNPSWHEYETSLKNSAWKHYCLDILNSRWKGSGDKKMDSIIFDKNYYAQPISWHDFGLGIMQWYNTSKMEKREYKRVAPPQEAEKMFLAMLYLPIFTAADQVDHSQYDVEHLATKKLMKSRLERYNGDLQLPIGSIGNLCLLPQRENRSKQEKTIYCDDKFLQSSKYSLADLEKKFTFTLQTDLDWVDDNSLDMKQLENRYMAYIDARFARIMEIIKNNYEK